MPIQFPLQPEQLPVTPDQFKQYAEAVMTGRSPEAQAVINASLGKPEGQGNSYHFSTLREIFAGNADLQAAVEPKDKRGYGKDEFGPALDFLHQSFGHVAFWVPQKSDSEKRPVNVRILVGANQTYMIHKMKYCDRNKQAAPAPL